MIYIALYLVAIVAANLSIAMFGASAVIFNAFVFISLDLTARDSLHEQWKHQNLWRNMALLIASGSILSALLNVQALPVAIASFCAFSAAGLVDAVTYSLLGDKSRMVKMNGSNVLSAVTDSVVFVAILGLPLAIVPLQILAKIVGGFVWSFILTRKQLSLLSA